MNDTENSFTTQITTQKTPHEVFEAVTNVRDWWSRTIQGETKREGDEFIFEVKGVHYSKQKLVTVVPDTKVVWLVTESKMTFIPDEDEWTGTRVIFDIAERDGQTTLTFTHEGLVPAVACYKACEPAWTQYVQHSLRQLIETGKGDPNLEGRTIEAPVV